MNNMRLNNYLQRFILISLFLCCTSIVTYAQYLIDQTYYKPVEMIKPHTSAYESYLSNGARFIGKKTEYRQGSRVTDINYSGTIIYSNGDKLMTCATSLGSNFNYQTGDYYYLTKNGTLYKLTYRNGTKISEYKDNRRFYIKDNCIRFYANGYYTDGGGSVYNGGSNSSVNSPSSNNSSSSQRMCTACNGRGNCRLCSGNGRYMPSISTGHYITCTMCNGSGKCTGCNGTGKR